MNKIVLLMFVALTVFLSTKTALACKGSQVLFEDSFATMDPAWGEASSKQSVKDGKLIIQPEAGNLWSVINQATIFEDMDACVKVSLAGSDDPSWGGGLIFWAKGYDEYYYLLINGEGWFAVRQWIKGRALDPVPWRESAALKKGVGAVNQLRVVAKGDEATVYLNDTQAVTFKGQPPDGGSFIGVIGNAPSVWEFSDFKVTKPDAVEDSKSTHVAGVDAPGQKAAAVGEVIYEDNFATLDPAWGAASDNLGVANGKLVVKPEINSSYVLLNQARMFEDMDASVRVTQVTSDDPTYSAGLIFWAKDTSDYHYFIVTSDGWYAVKRWVNQRSLSPVVWRENTAINKGLGQTNELRVVTRGSKATIYVNGTELVSFEGEAPPGGSSIGMIAFSPEKATNRNVWEFSGLSVRK